MQASAVADMLIHIPSNLTLRCFFLGYAQRYTIHGDYEKELLRVARYTHTLACHDLRARLATTKQVDYDKTRKTTQSNNGQDLPTPVTYIAGQRFEIF